MGNNGHDVVGVGEKRNPSVQLAVGHENGMVVMKLEGSFDRIDFDPETAISVAEALTRHAFESRDGMKPLGKTLKAELIERHRRVLNNRLFLVLKTLREDKTVGHKNLARQIVDICFNEVFK